MGVKNKPVQCCFDAALVSAHIQLRGGEAHIISTNQSVSTSMFSPSVVSADLEKGREAGNSSDVHAGH